MISIDDKATFAHPKIRSEEEADIFIAKAREEGRSIGLCVGGFDLLHPGHVKHFESAKAACDVLVVGVTTDTHVAERKGEGRPIYPAELRAYMIASLACVDLVVISDHALAVPFIERFKPDRYIKGPDYINNDEPGILLERESIEKAGGEMFYTEDEKLATSEIIAYVRSMSLS